MGTPTRRAVLKSTAALAGLAAAQTSGLTSAAAAAPAGTGSGHVDVFGGSRISTQAWQASFNVAASASPGASYACADQGLRLVTVEGGPHNIGWTHPDEVSKPLLEFLAD